MPVRGKAKVTVYAPISRCDKALCTELIPMLRRSSLLPRVNRLIPLRGLVRW